MTTPTSAWKDNYGDIRIFHKLYIVDVNTFTSAKTSRGACLSGFITNGIAPDPWMLILDSLPIDKGKAQSFVGW